MSILDMILAQKIAASASPADYDPFIAGTVETVTCKLTEIPDFAFSAKNDLVTVNIPNATYIGQYAFSAGDGIYASSEHVHTNNSLTTVNMPSVVEIGKRAFYKDANLEITALPDSLKRIEDGAFNQCPKVQLTALPPGITYIGNYALDVQQGLDLGEFPVTLEFIGGGTDPQTIYAYLDQFVTDGVLDLSQVAPVWVSATISPRIIGSGLLFSNYNVGENVVIPQGAPRISAYLLMLCCADMKTLTIPYGVTKIGINAFYGAEALESLTLPESLSHIGDGAFNGAKAMESLTLPESLSHIGDDAFFRCHQLSGLKIPGGVKYIGNYAFGECNSLAVIDLTDFTEDHVIELAGSANDRVFATENGSRPVGFKVTFSTQAALDAFAASANWGTLWQYFVVETP